MNSRSQAAAGGILALLVLTAGGGGCKRPAKTAEDWKPLHFVMGKPQEKEAWTRVFERFEEENPSLRIVREVGPASTDEFHDLLVAKLSGGGRRIDAFLMDAAWPSEFARAGFLAPLDGVISEDERSAFFPAALRADTIDGKLWGLPFSIDAGLLYYRKDLLSKYGLRPPDTWEEALRHIATVLEGEAQEGLYGFTGQFRRDEGLVCNLLEFVYGNGGRFLDEAGEPSLLDPRTIEAVRFVRDRIIDAAAPRASLSDEELQSREKFARGDAVFHRSRPDAWAMFQDTERSQVVGKVGLTALPRYREDGPKVAALGGWQLAVARRSASKDAAFRLVRFLTSRKVQRQMTLETARSFARVDLYDDAQVLKRFPHFRALKPAFIAAEPRPATPVYAAVSQILQDFLYEAVSDRESNIEKLARAATKRLRAATQRTAPDPVRNPGL